VGTGTTSLEFTGRESDGATGLYYYRARYYSPQLGRFISEDPIGLGGGQNFYRYVYGNPIQLRDPRGECPWCAAVAIGATYGMVQSVVNGWVSGDRDWKSLSLDAVTGAVSGGAQGAVVGWGLTGIGVRALIGAGGEAWRQLGHMAIDGCVTNPGWDIALAGGASVFGDSTALVYRGFARESASEAMHYSVKLADEVGFAFSSIANEVYSLPVAVIQFRNRFH
jgi:RHS repeat-associated protein